MRFIGVDPGASGAIAIFAGSALLAAHDMPVLMVRRGKSDKAEIDTLGIHDLVNRATPEDIVVFEQVGGITGQSASAAFNFGRSVGLAEATFRRLGYRIEFVTPQVWKRDMKLGPGKDDSRAAAMRLWPESAHLFQRKKDDGRAEAALIAEWGRRKFGGSNGIFD